MTEIRPLFPPIEPYHTGWLKVSDLHTLYYEEVGNPDGIPVLFLHGGPGVGVQPLHRRYYDPQIFHAILLSQRGAGKSTPSGELHENTTWDLVEDIETLRRELKIECWFVFGGSWGSTLALVYATRHPEAVRGLVLRGIFLGTRSENDWLYVDGASRIHPELWERYTHYIPEEERKDIVSAYYKRLTSSDRKAALDAAYHWYDWEEDIIRLLPRQVKRMEDDELLAFARIECHYMVNHLFFPHDNYLIGELNRITQIPCWIAQGRYDVICPPVSAFQLAHLLPKSELHMIPDAGHSIAEPGIVDSLIRGLEEFSRRY
jgi:proline iminopeptidase